MEPLNIEGTDLTPAIMLDPAKGHFEIAGYSRPEDVNEFYQPVVNWLQNYRNNIIGGKLDKGHKTDDLNFKFKLTYFNSASTKFITEVLFIVRDIKQQGIQVNISWYYEEYDEDMMEVGEDLSAMIKIPFTFYTLDDDEDDDMQHLINH